MYKDRAILRFIQSKPQNLDQRKEKCLGPPRERTCRRKEVGNFFFFRFPSRIPGSNMAAHRSRLKPLIQSSFKLHGFQLRVDACKHLEELLSALDSSQEWSHWIDKILETLASKDLDTSVIDKAILSKIIQVYQRLPSGSFERQVST